MKILIYLIALLLSLSVNAQQDLSGRILNNLQEPVPNAVVSLYQADDDFYVKGALSNLDGEFKLKLIDEGVYVLEIKSLGFKDYKSEPITIDAKTSQLADIILQVQENELSEVTVVAEKPIVEVRADKTIFNVAETINAVGDNGLELLRKAPGVIIDNTENIIVEGKSGVLVYINDRPSVLRGQDLVNFLKTLQASDIENIEIITQPSSRYDAEGNAGIININLKKDKSLGTNGSIASGIVYGDYARYNNSLSFNSRKKKTNLYGTYSNNFGKSTGFINLNRTQNNTNFDAKSTSVFDNMSNNIRLGFDFFASDKSTFGVIVNGNFNNSESETNTRTPIRPLSADEPLQVLISESDTDSETSNIFTNFNYRYKDTLGRTLDVNFDYGKYKSERFNLQPNTYFGPDEAEIISENSIFFDTPTDINIISGQIDYKQNLWNGMISLGVKYAKVNTQNSFDAFDRTNGTNDLDETQSNDFEYDEQISATYINYNKKFDKFNFQLGLRMEHTISDGDLTSLLGNQDNRVQRDYINWFPSGGITYNMNQNNTWALIYSRRIQRPNYQSLNPFQYRIDELSFRQGNPFLQPQYTDNIKLSHTYKYRLTTSLSYSFISDFFAQVTEAGEDNTNFIIQRNVANQKVINLGVSLPTKFNNWWSIYFSLNAYRSIYEPTNPDFVALSQNTLSFFAQNTFKLPKGYTAEVSGWFSSPSVWGGTYEIESLGSLNIAFQKKFFNDKLTARLGFNDILYTVPWRGTTQFGDLFIDGNGGSDSRQIRFNLTYNFGRKEIKKVRKRDTSIEDEKNRI